MNRYYYIESDVGQDLGVWVADTAVDALAAMLRAQYGAEVVVEEGRLVIADAADAPQQYQITEITSGGVRRCLAWL